MHIRVDRDISNNKTTLSKIYLDNVFYCYGLEDQYQKIKVKHETRIPAGTYKIQLRYDGGMTKKYAARYNFHQGMLHLQNVPGFKYIYIHTGNREDQTSGCLLVGQKRDRGAYTVSSSRYAYSRLYQAVVYSAKHDNLTITYEDNDMITQTCLPSSVVLPTIGLPAYYYE